MSKTKTELQYMGKHYSQTKKLATIDAYVYLHKKADTGDVFYVGIGSKPKFYRAYEKIKRSKHWVNLVNKHGFVVEILHTGLTWSEAQEKEMEIISLIGRIDLGTGPLINRTAGGDGANGVIVSEETKTKITLGKLGKKRPPITEETRIKLSLARKGVLPKNFGSLHTPEINKKRGESIKKSVTQVERDRKRDRWASGANPRAKIILNKENGIFYDTLKDAWIASGLSCCRPMFSMMLLNKKKNKTQYIYA